MNKNQLVVIWVTIAILSLLGIFPMRQVESFGKVVSSSTILYRARGFFLKQKLYDGNHSRLYYYSTIDLEAMVAQMIPVALIGTGLFITLKDKKSEE